MLAVLAANPPSFFNQGAAKTQDKVRRGGRVRVGGRAWERGAGVAEGLGARGEMTLGPHASRGIAAQNRLFEARPLARMHPLRRVGSTSHPKAGDGWVGRWVSGRVAGGEREVWSRL